MGASLTLAVGTMLFGVGGAGSAAPGASVHEVGTWGASADRTIAALDTQTVRDVVHTSIGGSGLRIRLSNAFGSAPVTFGHAYVGVQASGAALVAGSNRQVTFGGSPSVTIPVGAQVLSDPLPGTFPAQTNLAVSLHLQGAGGTVTGHNAAHQTSYVSSTGDHAAEESAAAFTTTMTSWYWLDGVVVTAPHTVDAVAALGDSITDGTDSTTNANNRWTDVLARRLLQRPAAQQMGVLNEGIAGNMVTGERKGVSAQTRFDRDVLSQPGLETVILLEGINDINLGGPDGQGTSADALIAGYGQLIARAHARGKCIAGGTLTPFEGSDRFTEPREAVRQAVNSFIRTSGEFDAVIDFDRAVRDPAHPSRYLPRYDSADHLHPSDAGHQAMGDAVNLSDLVCKRR
ncbi:SGNH/GDSL hydrolase family protein [Nocardioides sp. LHG3406-4]|uniref:SGNH/GDSL hydrolase family protein n=1 Tax=Nocardioides sp. LHG3406-4 TaxID=2804575 RepID=UPI003CF65965